MELNLYIKFCNFPLSEGPSLIPSKIAIRRTIETNSLEEKCKEVTTVDFARVRSTINLNSFFGKN